MADQVYWLGLMTAAGTEPVAAQGYARVRLVLPEGATYTNTAPILFCRARRAWPILTHAGLFQTADPSAPRWVAPLRALPGWTTLQPLAVDEGEEATIPPYGLEVPWAVPTPPRTYGSPLYGAGLYGPWLSSPQATAASRKFGRYQYGIKAFGRWNGDGFVGMRCGAGLLADRIPVVCAPWVRAEAVCAPWARVETASAPWARAETWQGRVCA